MWKKIKEFFTWRITVLKMLHHIAATLPQMPENYDQYMPYIAHLDEIIRKFLGYPIVILDAEGKIVNGGRCINIALGLDVIFGGKYNAKYCVGLEKDFSGESGKVVVMEEGMTIRAL